MVFLKSKTIYRIICVIERGSQAVVDLTNKSSNERACKGFKNLTAAFALKYIEEVVENLLTHLCILFLVNSCSLTNVPKKSTLALGLMKCNWC